MSLVTDAVELVKKRGIIHFLSRSIQHIYKKVIRPFVPAIDYYKINSVRVDEMKMLDRYFLQSKYYSIWYDHISSDNEPAPSVNEGGIVSAQKKLIQSGDSVVIIGGGFGVTAIRAAKQVGEDGQIIVFEASKECVRKIRKVINWNGVEDRCKVEHALVGNQKSVRGDIGNAKHVHPTDLPKCDVLELDCEGSELGITRNLQISPRIVIMELHPHMYDAAIKEPLTALIHNGYNVEYRSGHDSVEVSCEEFDELLHRDRVREGDRTRTNPGEGYRYVESGAWAPVIAGLVKSI